MILNFFILRSKKSFSKLAPMASSSTNAKVIARNVNDDDDDQIYEQHQINISLNNPKSPRVQTKPKKKIIYNNLSALKPEVKKPSLKDKATLSKCSKLNTRYVRKSTHKNTLVIFYFKIFDFK